MVEESIYRSAHKPSSDRILADRPSSGKRDDVVRSLEGSSKRMVKVVSSVSPYVVVANSLSKLGLYLAFLDIDNTDVSDDLTFLPGFFT